MPDQAVVLVFAESDGDRVAISALVKGLAPGAKVKLARAPIVLQRGAHALTKRDNVAEMAKVVRSRLETVVMVVAHRDADDIEPAHLAAADELELHLRLSLVELGLNATPVAAVPAFEIEAWWLLFPDAVAAVVPSWAPIKKSARSTGRIRDAKEHLRRALRPKGHPRCPDYDEAVHSRRIAEKVREMGLARKPHGENQSWTRFVGRIDATLGSER